VQMTRPRDQNRPSYTKPRSASDLMKAASPLIAVPLSCASPGRSALPKWPARLWRRATQSQAPTIVQSAPRLGLSSSVRLPRPQMARRDRGGQRDLRRADRQSRGLQRAPSQYDHLAPIPVACTCTRCGRRKASERRRRHQPARRVSGVVATAQDAWSCTVRSGFRVVPNRQVSSGP
jgi:hypothetical protein